MRRLIKILIVTLFTITISNVYAFSDPITVEINGNSVLVKNNDDLNIIGSNYVSYDGSKLTINEGTTIKKLKVDKSIEITSNNKKVILGEVVHTNNNLITITYNNLNSVQSEISFNANSSNTYHIITNSTINNYLYVNGFVDKSDDGYGLIIKNSIIDCNSKYAEQYVYGAILVENTKYNGGPFHSEHNTITFKDSDITSRGYMYIEPPEGAFYIYNSKVTSVDSSEITIYVSVDNVENNDLVVVDDSDLTNVFIRNNQKNKTRIVNSNFINTSSNTMELYNSYIDNSTFDFNNNSTFTVYGDIINSKINNLNSLNMYRGDKGINHITNSYFNNSKRLNIYGNTIIDKSKLEAIHIYFDGMTDVSNSYIKCVNNNPDNYTIDVITVNNKLNITNTYMYLLLNKNNYPAILGNNDTDINIDGNIFDLSGNRLNLLTMDSQQFFSRNSSVDGVSNSLTIVPDINITFRVVNGTWADGTTDDIVIKISTWDTLKDGSIPIDILALNGFIDGEWDTVPNTIDELKENMVFTYTFNEAVKGVEENPKTGIKSYAFVLIIAAVAGYLYYYIKTKKELFR